MKIIKRIALILLSLFLLNYLIGFLYVITVFDPFSFWNGESAKRYFKDKDTRQFISYVLKDDFAKADEMIAQGVDINRLGVGKSARTKEDIRTITPMHWFIRNGEKLNTARFEYLMSLEPDILIKSPILGYSAFHEAAAKPESVEYLSYFINELGIDPDAPASNPLNPTALFLTAENDNIEAVRLLVDAGADVNYSTANGMRVLGNTFWGSSEDTYILLRAGAEIAWRGGRDIDFQIERALKRKLDFRQHCIFPKGQTDWFPKVLEIFEERGVRVEDLMTDDLGPPKKKSPCF